MKSVGKVAWMAGMALGLNMATAEAALTAYSPNGVELVYSSLGNVTWTADGNLFKTLADGYAGGTSAFLNAVIASVPEGKINDSPNYWDTPANSGYHTLSASDFNTTTGRVNWFGAKAYVTYLNSINYGGSNQWRLPNWTDTGAAGPQYGISGTDFGYNVNPASSELAQLYYAELGKTAYVNTSGEGPQSNYGILGSSTFSDTTGSVGPFSNVHTFAYWLGTEYTPDGRAWDFFTTVGVQGYDGKDYQSYAWAVSSGQVAAVPLPGAMWLMGTGLIGLLGLKWRGQAG
ncbi:DUF1566 domain-containing protein [Methylomonas sp. MK1]|uniref:DUF1566 domain-containing protein n=1 Tax=Methylomonas sp. MK1 TaxID=1131552 RepID=UPI0003759ED9|nr:DUF1566 domain-containing protein [Methylomonas sp. MK1]